MIRLRIVDLFFDSNIAYQARKTPVITRSLGGFSYDFTFGQSFLLDSERYGYGETLNWIIAGQISEDSGLIEKDNIYFHRKDRKKEVWFVRESTVRPYIFSFREPSVKDQIQYGLKTFKNQSFTDEQSVIKIFKLTPERYQRPLRVLSTEKWRASCAIGFVNGKRIFCFPYMEERFIEDYYDSWLKEMIDFLARSGALVLIPTAITDVTRKLCDRVVTFDIDG
jgi:hypothetical protein